MDYLGNYHFGDLQGNVREDLMGKCCENFKMILKKDTSDLKTCAKCKQIIDNKEDYFKCKNTNCSKYYHAKCCCAIMIGNYS